jgi:hypothetical protein
MTIFLSMFVVAVLVGFMAQKWKGRTGAAWWFLTMVLEALAYGLCVVAVANRPDLLRDPVTPISMAILSIVLGAGPVAVIVATLPKRVRGIG